MQKVYLDNGATSFPKAPGVSDFVKDFLDHSCLNINRSGYGALYPGEELVFSTREKLCRLFNFPKPENVIFTQNATMGLNLLLKGLLKNGDHCLISSLEHNAVMRPITQLAAGGVQFSKIPSSSEGFLDPQEIPTLLKRQTKALLVTHASNVSGTILPLEEIGKICAERELFFIIDAAQSGGSLPIDFRQFQADALVFTGHKGLLGPQGLGGFLIAPKLAKRIVPLISGGTGSLSESEEQPDHLPDKFEAGTLNLPGIAGLSAALDFLEKESIAQIRQQELKLTGLLQEGLGKLPGVRVVGPRRLEHKTALVSIDCQGLDNAEVSFMLNKKCGILTRCGLHCAPSAHQALGTFPQGTIRFTPGYFNTAEEMDYTIASVGQILTELRRNGSGQNP